MTRQLPIIETEITHLDGVPLIVPLVGGKPLEFPWDKWEKFPTYCGAGRGIGDLVVPDVIFGLKVSPVCFIHDVDFALGPPTWEGFHAANYRFLNNLNNAIRYRSQNIILQHLRMYRAVTYFNAVDTVGALAYWAVKASQGYEKPNSSV